MFSPLLDTIIRREGFAPVGLGELDAGRAGPGDAVLFFPGDFARLGESDDVAVILPELWKAFGKRFTPFVVTKESERDLQKRYRFNAFPALVFLRGGLYLGAITGVLDWSDYLDRISEILSRAPSDPPPFRLPDGCSAPQPALPH